MKRGPLFTTVIFIMVASLLLLPVLGMLSIL